MRASLVIRTYNEARYLPILLAGVRRQTFVDGSVDARAVEVILVDSGSTDGTKQIAQDFGCRVLEISRDEFSFGRSLNIGCEAAKGDALVFISGHCVPVDERWLDNLIRPLAEDASLTYGRQLGGDTSHFSECQIFQKHFPAANEPAPNGFFCNNANAAVRRDVWARFRFDETLTGLEDLHLGKRLVEVGLKIQYVPGAGVHHYHSESWKQVAWRFEREALALQRIMPEIHVHWSDALRYVVAATARDWSKALRERKFLKTAGAIAAYRSCQYYGVWKGNHLHRRLSRAAKDRYFYPR